LKMTAGKIVEREKKLPKIAKNFQKNPPRSGEGSSDPLTKTASPGS